MHRRDVRHAVPQQLLHGVLPRPDLPRRVPERLVHHLRDMRALLDCGLGPGQLLLQVNCLRGGVSGGLTIGRHACSMHAAPA